VRSQKSEHLETERLILRRPVATDAPAIFERYAGDADVTRFLSWPRHRSLDDTHGFLIFSDHEWERAAAGPFVILSRNDGRLLGGTGLMFETPARASTGYVLARDAWGSGYATEALMAMVGLARQLGVIRLYAQCHADHRASARVLEKGGFTLEGRLTAHSEFPNFVPGIPQDVLNYAAILR
jgi:RimJ/RimL family protein N-acetyltransferase